MTSVYLHYWCHCKIRNSLVASVNFHYWYSNKHLVIYVGGRLDEINKSKKAIGYITKREMFNGLREVSQQHI